MVRYSVLYRIEYSIVLYRTMYTVPYNCSGEITVTAAGIKVTVLVGDSDGTSAAY